MNTMIVVNQPSDWQFDIPDVEVVPARRYLTDPSFSKMRGVKLFNLCRSYRYQSTGYYVSLLAAARGHKPLPTVTTIQDMKLQPIIRVASDELEDLTARTFAAVGPPGDKVSVNIYFGRSPHAGFERVGAYLFKQFEAPLLRADFALNKNWQLQNVSPISTSEIPDAHHQFLTQAAGEYFSGRRIHVARRSSHPYDMAILWNTPGTEPASDDKAIQRFVKAAAAVGFDTEVIQKDDYGRMSEFDALFIRETTSVVHHTYRMARRAAAEGLVVIDDPESILRCTNKVYLEELLGRHHIPTPKTVIVHKDNANTLGDILGYPCILKQPDSSFSQGVVKAENPDQLRELLAALLDRSDLVIAQEFVPTEFDWRIGVIDRKPLYACKYFMARRHWQILKKDHEGRTSFGRVETLPVELAPRKVVRTALVAANLIGDGLYGVDVKQFGNDVRVIEINDNPTIEAGDEDAILKDQLYERILESFLRRVERRRRTEA